MGLVLACDITGQPHQWLSRESAIILKVKEQIAYEFGDDQISMFGGISRMTGNRSQVDVMNIVTLKAKHKIENRVPTLTNQNLFGRDLHMCAYCARTMRSENLTRDHIVPRSRGGKDVWMNVVTACKHCNNHKDNKLLEECHMELLYVPYIPNRAEHLVLQNRRIKADQMDYLKAYLPAHSRVKA